MKIVKEKWADGYYFPDKYEVSDLGRVRNKITKRIYKASLERTGYLSIFLRNKGQRVFVRVHRLVYLSFNPQTPLSLNVHHLDHIRNNNKLSNLGAIDHKTHASMHAKIRISSGTFPQILKKGAENISYKGRVIAICPQTNIIKHIMCGKSEMRNLGFRSSKISLVVNGFRKRHRGLFFKRIPDILNFKVGQLFSE
jgi:hypothetical protein